MRYRDELDGERSNLCTSCGRVVYRISPLQAICPCGAELPEYGAAVCVVIGACGRPLLLPARSYPPRTSEPR